MEKHSFELFHQDDKGKVYFDEEVASIIKDNSRIREVIAILTEENIINSLDSSGNTLLHIAAQYDNIVIAQHLIRSGCKIDVQNNSGKTPLIVAIENRCQFSIDILLDANADIFIFDNEGKNALNWFFDSQWLRRLYLVHKLLKKVESQCLNDSEVIASKLLDAGWPLPCVASLDNTEVFKIMLERGSRVDEREPIVYRTALHEAVLASDVERVKLLLDHDADPNATDKFYRSPLHYVFDREKKHTDERLEIVKLLIGRGAAMITSTDNSTWSQVDLALRYGNREVIELLLGANLDITRKHEGDNTPVHLITANQNTDAFKALENRDFEVDARNARSETPLWIAASNGNACAAEILLERGADVHAANPAGLSPLHRCVERFSPRREAQWKSCVASLLEHGADVQQQSYTFNNQDPSFVLDVVKADESYAVGELLIAHLVLQEAWGTSIKWYIYGLTILRHSTFKKYYEFCKQQLAEPFYKDVTLLDLFNASNGEFERYARDERFVSRVQSFSSEWESKSYYFNRILQKRYSNALHTLKLRRDAAIFICKIMKTEYCRFPLIADQIVSYLDVPDLQNLAQVSL